MVNLYMQPRLKITNCLLNDLRNICVQNGVLK